MPTVTIVAIDLLDTAVLRLTLAPSQHHSPVGQEHGRTIPLPDFESSNELQLSEPQRACPAGACREAAAGMSHRNRKTASI